MTDIYNRSDVYLLKCDKCPLKYVGQIGRTLRTRFKEHIHDMRNNRPHSKYAQHILDAGHKYGVIDQIMEVLHVENKGCRLNTLERFEIYKLIQS
jgi:hypothetical protein